MPNIKISGFDISNHGLKESRKEIRENLFIHKAQSPYPFKDNEFDAVVFNKKKEYDGAFLSIDNIADENKLKYLIGYNNEIIKNETVLTEKIDNKVINKMLY